MKFKVGDKVVSAMFDEYAHWKGLTVDREYDGQYVYCTSATGLEGAFLLDDLTLAKPPRDYVADHARRSLRKLGLTKQEAAAFVRNVQGGRRVEGHADFTLSQLSRNATHAELAQGFYWAESKEGFNYWEAIERRISEQGWGK